MKGTKVVHKASKQLRAMPSEISGKPKYVIERKKLYFIGWPNSKVHGKICRSICLCKAIV